MDVIRDGTLIRGTYTFETSEDDVELTYFSVSFPRKFTWIVSNDYYTFIEECENGLIKLLRAPSEGTPVDGFTVTAVSLDLFRPLYTPNYDTGALGLFYSDDSGN